MILRLGFKVGLLVMLDVSNICLLTRVLLFGVSMMAFKLSCDINFCIVAELIVKLSGTVMHLRRASLSLGDSDLPLLILVPVSGLHRPASPAGPSRSCTLGVYTGG